MSFKPDKPHNDLPNLPPQNDIETKPILRACIVARAHLAELNASANLLPNQSVLINTIPIMEAKDSSEIENIVTTTDKIFKASHSDGKHTTDAATKEAFQYRSALLEGFASIKTKPLCTATAVAICSRIKNADMDIRRVPGTALASGNKVIYTPPVGETVIRDKLTNWERFLHEQQAVDPLIRMAIGHYQFEAIHPFSDGNGRTGRVLNLLYLVDVGLLNLPIFYHSRYIMKNRSDYYQKLYNVTKDNDWESWIIFMLEAVSETAHWTSQKINGLRLLMDHTSEYLKSKLPALYSHEFTEILFNQPYCRIANLTDAGIAKRQTASVYLKELSKLGILEEIKSGREKLFFHTKFYQLLVSESNEFNRYQ